MHTLARVHMHARTHEHACKGGGGGEASRQSIFRSAVPTRRTLPVIYLALETVSQSHGRGVGRMGGRFGGGGERRAAGERERTEMREQVRYVVQTKREVDLA